MRSGVNPGGCSLAPLSRQHEGDSLTFLVSWYEQPLLELQLTDCRCVGLVSTSNIVV